MNLERPYNEHFQEHYWSQGIPEKAHVFLGGNDLEMRFAAGQDFVVGELGFGTGLNFLLAWELWARMAPEGAKLVFVSYELLPLGVEELRGVHGEFGEALRGLSGGLLEVYAPVAGWNVWAWGNVTLKLFVGDVRAGIGTQEDVAGAWFLDGFSPALNPEMWETSLLQQVGRLTVPGGTASTYSVAAAVREGLKAAGFEVGKVKGYPPKWQMLKAMKPTSGL